MRWSLQESHTHALQMYRQTGLPASSVDLRLYQSRCQASPARNPTFVRFPCPRGVLGRMFRSNEWTWEPPSPVLFHLTIWINGGSFFRRNLAASRAASPSSSLYSIPAVTPAPFCASLRIV